MNSLVDCPFFIFVGRGRFSGEARHEHVRRDHDHGVPRDVAIPNRGK